jgi:hypothetical protein
LPGEIGGGRTSDRRAQVGIGDLRDGNRQRSGNLVGGGDDACHPPLGRAIDGRNGSDMKAQLARLHAALAQPFAHHVGQQRQLVRPYAGRDAQQQHARRQRNGSGSLGDARADRIAP